MANFDITFDNDELDVSYSQDTFNVDFTTNTEFSASFTSEAFKVDFSEGGHQGPSGNNAQYVFFFVTSSSIVSPGNPTDNPDNWTAEADITEDSKVYFWAVADQLVNPDGTLIPIVASDWRIVAFPGALDAAEVEAAVAAYFEANPIPGVVASDFGALGDVTATDVGDVVQLDINWNTWPYPFVSNFNLPANSFWIDEGVVWRWMGGDNFEITLARYRNNQSGIVEKTGNSNWERHQTLAPIVEVHG